MENGFVWRRDARPIMSSPMKSCYFRWYPLGLIQQIYAISENKWSRRRHIRRQLHSSMQAVIKGREQGDGNENRHLHQLGLFALMLVFEGHGRLVADFSRAEVLDGAGIYV